jgi:GNAT superfamily N-acetyltransferase
VIAEVVEKRRTAHLAKPEIRLALREDAEEMLGMFSRLSQETLYMRFHLPYRSVPGWALERFAGAGFDGECLVAVAEDGIIGHAMYASQEDGREAEVALVVEDAWQRRGIGKRLLHELARRAKNRGVETFFCLALGENRRVPGLVGAVFEEVESRIEDGRRNLRSPLRSLKVSESG